MISLTDRLSLFFEPGGLPWGLRITPFVRFGFPLGRDISALTFHLSENKCEQCANTVNARDTRRGAFPQQYAPPETVPTPLIGAIRFASGRPTPTRWPFSDAPA